MEKPPVKLYGPLQITIMAMAVLVGVGIFMWRRYQLTGDIGVLDIVVSLITITVAGTIMLRTVRKGNQKEE
ncbi:hypothetical protein OPIT5_09085 [Opitutaceae bacterium TAV5]|nr:hypothetical protein OPIT5_09085 [Opitutaceae bacterium TAV5]